MAVFKEVRQLRLDQLVLSPQQARTRDVEKGLDELVENIRVQGQLEPIIVSPASEGDRFEIVAGQRRWLALRRLGAATIHAAILDHRIDEVTAQAISVSENLVRRDLSGKDLISICTRLHHRYGSVKAVAEELGLPYNKVRSYVKFDRLRPELKTLVESGRLDIKSAIRLEDHYGESMVELHKLQTIATALAEMTNAQKAEYFRAMQLDRAGGAPAAVADGTAGYGRRAPGAVRQILVTLRTDEVELLREWAKEHHLTQDAAAGQIIRAHLRRHTAAVRPKRGA
ncbi:ParB/RepB/Spo0J family partition protein [Kribbella sp. NBC_01245]|uniref:ParB/RepB/Spo0J family partition protein n=1 Tax=Kribbella sp. NBC_01245 TaxID=2903578 RepID=UPI002E2B1924|nr:ParB/RepB/Spo0J family partition protein [Kribbella sp. NBC_01245]